MNRNILQESRKTIFLADRNRLFLIYLRILLERMGFRIVPLEKGAVLQDLIHVMKPDLIMLGSLLEDMDGASLLKSLQQEEVFSGVPVVLFCGTEDDKCSQSVRESGEVCCLDRPVNIFQLHKVLYDLIIFSPGRKRVHLRTSFREKVIVSHGDKETELWATSLSDGGIFVRSRDPLPAGDDVTVSVPLGFDEPSLFKGKVLYSMAADPHGISGTPGTAIQFASVSNEQVFRLQICILGILAGDLLEEQQDGPIFSVALGTNDTYEDIVIEHVRVGQEPKGYQNLMKILVDSLPFGAIICGLQNDGKMAVVNVNHEARMRFGPHADSLEELSALFPQRYDKNLDEIVMNLSSKDGKVELRELECLDNQMGIFDITAFQAGTGNVVLIFQDVSGRKKKQEEELRLHKLESIGTLAGGIAHDFNNLLQGAFGYISMAKITIDDKERSLAMLEQAESALQQSVKLTTQLLTFSKGGKPVKTNFPLQPLLDTSVRFALSGSHADFRINFADDLWAIEADESQIGQVIHNIVLNADQSMPHGGPIVISARNVPESEKVHLQLTQDNYVEISVQDTGIGIPANYLQKIFDPYVTTKEKGSGMGLATSYSIIRNHDGLIDVVSEPGKGTTFFIYLPAVKAEKVIKESPAVTSIVHKGKILVMDDEELVRDIAGALIEALGHEVDVVEDGESAVAKYKAAMHACRPFDIVILDLTVRGGQGGKETIKRLLSIDPGVRAIVASGYSDDAVMADYPKYGFRGRLTKPYALEDLRDTLNELLSDIE